MWCKLVTLRETTRPEADKLLYEKRFPLSAMRVFPTFSSVLIFDFELRVSADMRLKPRIEWEIVEHEKFATIFKNSTVLLL